MSSEGDAFFKNLSGEIGKSEANVLQTLVNTEKNCYFSAGDDCEKFVDCMTKFSKKVKRQQRILDIKLGFLKIEAEKCFSKPNKSQEDCKVQAKNDLSQLFVKFMDNLK